MLTRNSQSRRSHSEWYAPGHNLKPTQCFGRTSSGQWFEDVLNSCMFSPFVMWTRITSRKSSIATMFTEEGGWPYGEIKDSDPILAKEKEIGFDNPVRAVCRSRERGTERERERIGMLTKEIGQQGPCRRGQSTGRRDVQRCCSHDL